SACPRRPIGAMTPRSFRFRIADDDRNRRYRAASAVVRYGEATSACMTAASAVITSAALSLDAVMAAYTNRKNVRIAAEASQGERWVAARMAQTVVRTMLLTLETMASNTVASYLDMTTTNPDFPSGTIFLPISGRWSGGRNRSRPPIG